MHGNNTSYEFKFLRTARILSVIYFCSKITRETFLRAADLEGNDITLYYLNYYNKTMVSFSVIYFRLDGGTTKK